MRDRDFASLIYLRGQHKNKKLKQNNAMEQRALKNVNNGLHTNTYSYLETSGGQSYNLYLNVAHFFNTSVN